MLRLIGVALSVGLADSLNPSTVGPGLYLATARNGVARVAQFTLGVFSVNFLAGLGLTIGPGRLLVKLVPHPEATARHVIDLIAGTLLVAAAAGLWLGRRRLAERELPGRRSTGRSALILGVSLAGIELPTAAPYFAVIAAVAASSVTVPEQIAVLAVYNVAFVVPLVAIIVVLVAAGDKADRWLVPSAAWLQRTWPVVLATVLLLIGSGLVIVAGIGLVKQ